VTVRASVRCEEDWVIVDPRAVRITEVWPIFAGCGTKESEEMDPRGEQGETVRALNWKGPVLVATVGGVIAHKGTSDTPGG